MKDIPRARLFDALSRLDALECLGRNAGPAKSRGVSSPRTPFSEAPAARRRVEAPPPSLARS